MRISDWSSDVCSSDLPTVPSIWTDEQLAYEAQRSLESFRDRRLAEPATRYPELLAQENRAVRKLIRLLSAVDPDNPDPAQLRKIWSAAPVFHALRYVADRKSTRLTQVTNAHHVCRLLLEKTNNHTTRTYRKEQ